MNARRAEEVSSFLVDLFKLSDPKENRGNQVTARELLDSGAKRLQSGLQDQPETKAALLSTVGTVYDSLGQFQDALPLLNESLQLQARSQDRSRIDTLLELGRARIGAGDLPGAEAPLQEALHAAQRDSGATSVQTGHSLWSLGMLRFEQGRNARGQGSVPAQPARSRSQPGTANRCIGRAGQSCAGLRTRTAMDSGKANPRACFGDRSTGARRR